MSELSCSHGVPGGPWGPLGRGGTRECNEQCPPPQGVANGADFGPTKRRIWSLWRREPPPGQLLGTFVWVTKVPRPQAKSTILSAQRRRGQAPALPEPDATEEVWFTIQPQ